MSVEIIHDHLGYRLAEEGTWAHRDELERIAESVRAFAPGAAAALTDWDGAEIARLRAYAVARSALRERLADAYLEARFTAATRDSYHLVA